MIDSFARDLVLASANRESEDVCSTRSFFFPPKIFSSFCQPEREQIVRISSNEYLALRGYKSANNISSRTIRFEEDFALIFGHPRISLDDISRRGLILSSVLAILQRYLIEDGRIWNYSLRDILEKYPVEDYSIRNNNFTVTETSSQGQICDTRGMSYRFRAIFLLLAAFSSNLLSRTIRFGAIISSMQ